MIFICSSASADIYGTINRNQVNIREEKSTKSDRLFQLDKGDDVEILVYDDDWCKIYFAPKKKSGYVMTKFLDADISTEKVPLSAYNQEYQDRYEGSLFDFVGRYNAAVNVALESNVVETTESIMLYDFTFDTSNASAEYITNNFTIHVDFGEMGQLIGFRLNIPYATSQFSTSLTDDCFDALALFSCCMFALDTRLTEEQCLEFMEYLYYEDSKSLDDVKSIINNFKYDVYFGVGVGLSMDARKQK